MTNVPSERRPATCANLKAAARRSDTVKRHVRARNETPWRRETALNFTRILAAAAPVEFQRAGLRDHRVAERVSKRRRRFFPSYRVVVKIGRLKKNEVPLSSMQLTPLRHAGGLAELIDLRGVGKVVRFRAKEWTSQIPRRLSSLSWFGEFSFPAAYTGKTLPYTAYAY
ncbi:unnamed protein product [Soboliphyme baturini]|uniref:Transposase n=1 Tax=Soboliphyme baturini TaxID=241478 RepID=A0A183INJ4_9BILA|nr:unnamed protein product [Soboliphyme baturini]